MIRFLVIVALLAVSGNCRAQTRDAFAFVDQSLVWKHATRSERVAVLIFAEEDNTLFSLRTTLKRSRPDRAISMDLKAGYLLFCGTWTKSSQQTVVANEHFFEAYRYYPTVEDRAEKRPELTLTLSGDTIGPLRQRLSAGERAYEQLPNFVVSDADLKAFKLVCGVVRR